MFAMYIFSLQRVMMHEVPEIPLSDRFAASRLSRRRPPIADGLLKRHGSPRMRKKPQHKAGAE
jgi:hypothetical protein